jgi:spermidine/putrescine transport system permease protein
MTLERRRRVVLLVLLSPGLLWLAIFYALPSINQFYVSLMKGTVERGYDFKWNWSVYGDLASRYSEQFWRSLGYAGTATLLALVISFPLAYFIAFRAGRWKNVLLLLIILPFFTSYLVRTVAWQTILTDDGFVVNTLQSLGILGPGDRLLATRTAVITGITYNFLPFMALPLYVSLEKVDRRLVEAATDLYASRAVAFRKVTLPLALPGILAGSLLTFIPAVGDFINAQLLGTSRQYMIGNVIQSKFLVVVDYPAAAALSFLMMAVLLAIVFAYVRLLGSRGLTEGVA